MEYHKILLVEDDDSLAFVVQDALRQAGYQVTHFADGVSALSGFSSDKFCLCLIDVMLPKKDGFQLAAEIRAINQDVPILFLTAREQEEDRLKGFRLGADDYITKPFSIEELKLRIQVFLKRTLKEQLANIFTIGNYRFDYPNLLLKLNDDKKKLTQKEADILKCLLQHSDGVLKREELLMQVWGDDDYFMGRSLDVFITRLRKYLSKDPTISIRNYHGVGFKLIQE